MDPIEGWLEHKCYNTLLKFVLDTILNILRDKLETIKETKPLAKASNDLVVVELCTIHKLISYPDFSQICQVINIVDRATQPTLKTTAGMLRCERNSQLMSKYIPQYKNGQEYNFSDKSAFTFGMTKEITEQEAKYGLRVLIDFMKSEAEDRHQGLTYEPLFTQLIRMREKGII